MGGGSVDYRLRKTVACLCGIVMAVSLLVTGCAPTGSDEPAVAVGVPIHQNGAVNSLPAGTTPQSFAATAEEQALLDSMVLQLENEDAALYLDMFTYAVAVLDKRTGHIWHSNPGIAYADPKADGSDEARNEANSQIKIEYYDNQNMAYQMYSYPDVVNGYDMDQVEVTCENGVLKLVYTFGKNEENMLFCRILTEETYNQVYAQVEQLVAEGVLMEYEFAAVYNTYVPLTLEEAEENKELMEAYPQIKNHSILYVMGDDTGDVVKSQLEGVYEELGWTLEDVEAENAKVGAGSEEQTGPPNFVIPLTYQLQGPDLLASINTAEITESKGMMLHKISFLNGLCAAKEGTDGYMLLPDGSGALVDNKVGLSDQLNYSLRFYGADQGLNLYDDTQLSSQVPFPVYGIKNGNVATFAVVESGEGSGGLLASLPDAVSSYSRIENWLEYRSKDTAFLSSGISSSDHMLVFAKKGATVDYRVRYHFLYGEQATYSGMAAYYRTYLEQTGGLKKQEELSGSLKVELLGAVDKKKQVLGFPVTVKESLTSFEEAEALIAELREAGITDLDVTYSGWMNGGVSYSLASKAKVESVLGGASGLSALAQQCEENGVSLYPDVDFAHIYREKLGSGYSAKRDAIQYISKEIARTGMYDPASGLLRASGRGVVLQAGSFERIVSSFLPSYEKLQLGGMMVSSFGSVLGGDYHGDKEILSREEAKLLTVEELKKISEQGYGLQLSTGNAYVLPYAESLVDVPLTSSGRRIESQSVPFVPMVLHGYVSYSGTALNLSQNFQQAFLETIEAGADLQFRLMAAENTSLKNTNVDNTFSVSASYWMDQVVELYTRWQQDLSAVAGMPITSHTRQGDVAVTTYQNGTRVYVNYSDAAVQADGISIPALDYVVVTG